MVKKHFCEILQGHGDICHMDFRIITRNGKKRWLSHSCQPVYGLDGRWLGWRGSNHDITERKKAEEGFKQLTIELERSNAELKQFAYAASHDLQEPLNVIGGYVRLLARRYKDKLDASAYDFIGYITERVANMQKLIKDLLEFSQVGTEIKKFEPISCASVVNRAIANLQTAIEESGALLTYGALPTVMTDPSQLYRLFQNLIGNAIKFRSEETPKIHISAERGRNEWVFSVRDNGIGIEKKDAERIFAVFQRVYGKSKYPGTGIGLAICKKIVEQHGRRIWVESKPGNGSTFHFTIPFSE